VLAIRFRESDAYDMLRENEEMPGFLGWLIAGVAVRALAVAGHGMLRKEMRSK
jgi:hypothetical protein